MHLSSLVCCGQLTRDAALAEVALPAYPPDMVVPDKIFVAKKLGISVEEFDAIMALPKKRFNDYPNLQNHWAFGRGMDLFRFLKHTLHWVS
jgi:hypothetical protein